MNPDLLVFGVGVAMLLIGLVGADWIHRAARREDAAHIDTLYNKCAELIEARDEYADNLDTLGSRYGEAVALLLAANERATRAEWRANHPGPASSNVTPFGRKTL